MANRPYNYGNDYYYYDDGDELLSAPPTTVVYQQNTTAQKQQSSAIGGLFKGALITYAVICTILITTMVICWRYWMLTIQAGVETSVATNETQGFMATFGGMKAARGPPAYMLRVGRAVATPLNYDKYGYDGTFADHHKFIAWARRSKQKVAAYDLANHEGLRFVGDPNANGDIGWAPLDNRLVRTFNYNLPAQPIFPTNLTPMG